MKHVVAAFVASLALSALASTPVASAVDTQPADEPGSVLALEAPEGGLRTHGNW